MDSRMVIITKIRQLLIYVNDDILQSSTFLKMGLFG